MTGATPIGFEVERFGWVTPGRLELTGRWSGVRGVRFVRPTLVLAGGDEHRRLLATLEDKPWPAADGVAWTAAFPWEGEPMDAGAAELSVAPGIVVRIDGPTCRAQRAARADLERAHENLIRERDSLRRERDALIRERDEALRARDLAIRERDAAAVVRDRLKRERASLADDRDELRDRLARRRDA